GRRFPRRRGGRQHAGDLRSGPEAVLQDQPGLLVEPVIAARAACRRLRPSPSTSALPTVASSGSRFMNSAVRNGPMRTVERKTPAIAIVIATTFAPYLSSPCRQCAHAFRWCPAPPKYFV